MKRQECAICSAPLTQPEVGRPRTYCGDACRRLAERKITVATALLARARRLEQSERAALARYPHAGEHKRAIAFWAGEVKSCEAELAALLAGDDGRGGEDAEASAAASQLARRRRR